MKKSLEKLKRELNKAVGRKKKAHFEWMNDFVQLLTKQYKYKTEHRYIAECEICGKFYFATERKKDMIVNLKFLDLGYKKKL